MSRIQYIQIGNEASSSREPGCRWSPTHLLCSPATYYAIFIGLIADALATVQRADALEILWSQGWYLHEESNLGSNPTSDQPYVQVILLSAHIGTPRHNDDAASDMPSQNDLCRRHLVLLSQCNNCWIRPNGIVSCIASKVSCKRKALRKLIHLSECRQLSLFPSRRSIP